MAKSLTSYATPKMLQWARETAHLSREEVAVAEKVTVAKVTEWETGKSSPSFAKLEKLGRRYRRPVMVFYLSEPPTEFTVVHDYRRLSGLTPVAMSTELSFALREAQERQAWAADYLEEQGVTPPSLPNVSSITNPNAVGRRLRERLGITLAEQRECEDARVAFNTWRSACESMGIFVFQAPGIPVSEMRGVAVPNRYAPMIVVNSRDSFAARSFTLIHELAHLVRGESAITGALTAKPTQKEEAFCNQVAAETLVPMADFVAAVPSNFDRRKEDTIAELAQRYRVSCSVIVFRLHEAGIVDANYLSQQLRGYAMSAANEATEKSKSTRIPRTILVLAQRGHRFSELASSAYYSGDIHGGQFSDLMAMSLKHLDKFESKLFPGRLKSG